MGAEKEKTLLEKIKNILFPTVCGICGRIDKQPLCSICSKKIEKLSSITIKEVQNKNFSKQAYLFKYGGIIREKLINYKFNEHSYLNETFANIIIKNEKICRFIKNYDIIIPVPIHRKRYKQRGYNQTELIAKRIAEKLGITVITDVLVKEVNNKPQSELTKLERAQNIKNVYRVQNSQKINNKTILIVDDIYTTGNTVNECGKMLQQAGANKISVLTIAKD